MVTSEDQSATVEYQLWVFGADEPNRLLGKEAFVTSIVYTVNEELHTISEIPAYTDVAAFLANLSAAEYASVKLVDASENDKATGEVVSDDKVVVASEDGETTVSYTLDVLVSTRDLLKGMISIYPNPVNDVLFIEGAPRGSSIHLINLTGQVLQVMEADSELIEVSVKDLAKGYYIINVTEIV
jgi:hypothetical protein